MNKSKINKCLVTGGCGFIGSHIVEKLIELGSKVIVIDDESAEQNDVFYKIQGAEYHKMNICDKATIDLYQGVDTVFHLAAKSRIQPTIARPEGAFDTNVLGTVRVLNNSKKHGVKKVIYSSSSSCYGHKNRPPHREDMLADCLTPYSLSKKQGEEVCKMFSDLYGLSTITLRYFNVYGPREPLVGSYAPVIGLFKKQKQSGEPITIVGDGEQRRDFTHVFDIVRANLMSADSNVFNSLFNIGTGKNYSINEIAKMIGGNTKHIKPRLGEARETLADISKATQILGWSPVYKLKDEIMSY